MPFFFLFSFAGCAWGIGGQGLSSLCRGWVLSLPSYRPAPSVAEGGRLIVALISNLLPTY